MTGVERAQLENQICLAAYKHRGNVNAIAEETGASPDYIRKTLRKLRKQLHIDFKSNLAYLIMGGVWTGLNQIDSTLGEIFSNLQGELYVDLSVCCNARLYDDTVVETHNVVKCGKCDKIKTESQVYRSIDLKKLSMMTKLDDQIRKHCECLITWSKSMGFAAQNPDTIIKQNTAILVEATTGSVVPPAGLDNETIKEVERMLPVERDMIIKKIESKAAKEEKINDAR